MEILLLLLQASSTWFMTGLIWFVQVVHYPLYDRVGTAEFQLYERDHCSLTTLVVAPMMVAELLSGAMLLFARPKMIGASEVILGLVLLAVIWFLTLFIADSLHGALASSFQIGPYRSLIAWNWLRTVAWTLRALLVTFMCYRCMQ
ncbi:hypothetical protein BH11CYA1_BH11CYA1_28370 [soil metagenome]